MEDQAILLEIRRAQDEEKAMLNILDAVVANGG